MKGSDRMKKIINSLFMFILGGIIFGGIGIYATSLYNAKDVTYQNESSEIKNVNDALNDLYKKMNKDNVIIMTGNSVLTNSKTIETSGKHNAILYYTSSNNGEDSPRYIYVKKNNEIIFTKSYVSNYNPYINYVELGEIEVVSGDVITLELNKSDNYSVQLLILS